MSKPSLSRSNMILLAAAACALLALPALADSQARIVRLSDVQGSVQIDKNTGLGFESAFLNLPITQGAQIRTHDRGRAEIEFEDGSTLRLTPNTTVEFSTLGLSDSGKRMSVINLVEGMAYVNWLGKSGDQFSLNFSREKISLDHAAHFRVQTSTQMARLAVFKGDVDVDGPAGKVTVEKKKMASFDASDSDKYTLAKNVEEAPLDSWDKEASSYHDQYAEKQFVSVRIWCQRPELLRFLLQRAGLRHDVAALLYRGRMGSVHEWRMVLVSRLRLHVCVGLSLGMDALPLRKLDVGPWNGLDVAARRIQQLAHRATLCRHAAREFPPPGCASGRECETGGGRKSGNDFSYAAFPPRVECRLGWPGNTTRFAPESPPTESSGCQIRVCRSADRASVFLDVEREFSYDVGQQRFTERDVVCVASPQQRVVVGTQFRFGGSHH